MNVKSTVSVIRPTWRNISQGRLPWLLRQKPVLDRLREVVGITDQGREAFFSVWGHIDMHTKERYISISPVERGEIFKAPKLHDPYDYPIEGLPTKCVRFEILHLHSHPNLGSGLSCFSHPDLKRTFGPALSGDPTHRIGVGMAALLQITKYGKYPPIAHLDFAQGTTALTQAALDDYRGISPWGDDAASIYYNMGLSYEKFTFIYKGQNAYLGLHPVPHELLQFKIWLNKKEETALIEEEIKSLKKFRDKIMDQLESNVGTDWTDELEQAAFATIAMVDRTEEMLSSLENGKSYNMPAAAETHFETELAEKLAAAGLYLLDDALLVLGIRGQFLEQFSLAIKLAVAGGKISPDFRVTINGEELHFWQKNNHIFSDIVSNNIANLLFREELIEHHESLAILPPDVIITGPNGEQFNFYYPQTIQESEHMAVIAFWKRIYQ
jgi:hypothetical protein